jgi:hypothetical protein
LHPAAINPIKNNKSKALFISQNQNVSGKDRKRTICGNKIKRKTLDSGIIFQNQAFFECKMKDWLTCRAVP